MKKIKIHKPQIKDKEMFIYHSYLIFMLGIISGVFKNNLFVILTYYFVALAFFTVARKLFVIVEKFLRSYYEKSITAKE